MQQPKKLLVVAGTRPEALKLAPVVRALKRSPARLQVATCFSGQHQEILRTVLGDLDLRADLALPRPPVDATLSQSLAWLLRIVGGAVAQARPHGVIVQGDTNTVLAGALASFHQGLPVFHVEAGLRTDDPMSPFPEEMNRRIVTQLAALHFAPTESARRNLLADHVAEDRIHVTGNTGIDALRIYARHTNRKAQALLARCRPSSRKLLVTLHRRENAASAQQVVDAVRHLVSARPDVEVLWMLHVNGIRTTVIAALRGHERVQLIEPQSYSCFVHLMQAADIVLTDSGGVQEEAPSLGKPVLVLRDSTERPEAVEAGSAEIVGCDYDRIVGACARLLDDSTVYAAMSEPRMPFGDGEASARIVAALAEYFGAHRGQRRDLPVDLYPEPAVSLLTDAASVLGGDVGTELPL